MSNVPPFQNISGTGWKHSELYQGPQWDSKLFYQKKKKKKKKKERILDNDLI